MRALLMLRKEVPGTKSIRDDILTGGQDDILP